MGVNKPRLYDGTKITTVGYAHTPVTGNTLQIHMDVTNTIHGYQWYHVWGGGVTTFSFFFYVKFYDVVRWADGMTKKIHVHGYMS